MTTAGSDFIISRQNGLGLKGVTLLAFGLVLAGALVLTDVSSVWWLPLFCLPAFVYFWAVLRTPKAIVFRSASATIELVYRFDAVAPKGRVSRFSDWSVIQSCMPTDDENQNVWLELRSETGKRLVLDVSRPLVDTDAGTFSWAKFHEPDRVRQLRVQVASFTGVRDLGFRLPSEN